MVTDDLTKPMAKSREHFASVFHGVLQSNKAPTTRRKWAVKLQNRQKVKRGTGAGVPLVFLKFEWVLGGFAFSFSSWDLSWDFFFNRGRENYYFWDSIKFFMIIAIKSDV